MTNGQVMLGLAKVVHF